MSPRTAVFLFALLASSLVSVFGALEQGIYRISNVESGTNLRSHVSGAPIYVTDVDENPGLDELWLVKRIRRSPEGFYTVEQLGLSEFASLNNATGDLVATSPTSQGFFIQEVGQSGSYTVKLPSSQRGWSVEPPFDHAFVKIRDATGTAGEQWRFESAVTLS